MVEILIPVAAVAIHLGHLVWMEVVKLVVEARHAVMVSSVFQTREFIISTSYMS